MKNNLTPEEAAGQLNRLKFLASKGIKASDSALAVHMLHQTQNMIIQRTDESILFFLRSWIPAIREVLPSEMQDWLHANDYLFQAVSHTTDQLTRKVTDTYCLYREGPPEVKLAFELNYQINPQLDGKGIFRLDMDQKEVPFPPDIQILKSA